MAFAPRRGARVDKAYRLAYTRPPTKEERAHSERSIESFAAHWKEFFSKKVATKAIEARAEREAIATFCQVVLNSPEFIYVD